jgi:hypothetical protein
VRYIFLDTEWATPTCLLTAAMVVTDAKFKILDTLEFKLKHDIYSVKPEAMAVNEIDLVKHHAEAEEADKIQYKIKEFLKKNTIFLSFAAETKRATYDRLQPVGHAIKSDIDSVVANFPTCRWYDFVRRNVIDTLTLSRQAQIDELIPEGSISLSAMAENFGIDLDAHKAYNDCIGNIEVYKGLLGIRK